MSTYFKYCKLSYFIIHPLSKKSLLSNRCPLTMLILYYMPLSNRCPLSWQLPNTMYLRAWPRPAPSPSLGSEWPRSCCHKFLLHVLWKFVTIKFSYFFFPMGKYQIGNINFTKTCIYSFFSFCRYWFWFGYISVKLTSWRIPWCVSLHHCCVSISWWWCHYISL